VKFFVGIIIVELVMQKTRWNGYDEAIELAKAIPEFACNQTAKIKVRPIKMKEETTLFVYPLGNKCCVLRTQKAPQCGAFAVLYQFN
jgi:hypothetical protein